MGQPIEFQPPFQKDVDSAKVNAITVVQSIFGYHVMQVTARGVYPSSEIKQAPSSTSVSTAQTGVLQAWLAKIEKDKTFFDQIAHPGPELSTLPTPTTPTPVAIPPARLSVTNDSRSVRFAYGS